VDFAVPHCEFVIKAGTYTPAAWVENSGVRVNKPLRIYSDDDDPAGVILLGAANNRALLINHPEAWVSGVTLANGANVNGAGVFFGSSGGVVSNSVIRNNSATSSGGSCVVWLDSTGALLTHSVVTNNTAYNHDSHTNTKIVIINGLVENCLVAGNRFTMPNVTGQRTSSIVELRTGGNGTIRNCTLAGNDVSERGVFHNQTALLRVFHCVIAGNNNVDVPGANVILQSGPNNVTDSSLDDFYEVLGLPNCRYAAPTIMFKNFAKGDYRLGSASPAINAGPPLSPQEIAAAGVDLDGRPRVVGTRMDHGCYESPVRGTLLLVR